MTLLPPLCYVRFAIWRCAALASIIMLVFLQKMNFFGKFFCNADLRQYYRFSKSISSWLEELLDSLLSSGIAVFSVAENVPLGLPSFASEMFLLCSCVSGVPRRTLDILRLASLECLRPNIG